MKRSGSIKHQETRVVWDEENLDFLEAHKTPKRKIDEPKTPYHPPGAEDNIVSPTPLDNAVHADAIRLALSQVASTSDDRDYNDGEGPSSSSASSSSSNYTVAQRRNTSYERETKSMDIDEPPTKPRRRKSFEEKRHMHHLEYRRAKNVLFHQPMIEEDESEYRDKNQASGSCSSCQEDQEAHLSKGLGDIDIQDAH